MAKAKAFTDIDKGSLMAIPCPDWTDTWHPIPHHVIVEDFENVLSERQIGVRNQSVTVFGENGGNMTYNLTLDVPHGEGTRLGFTKVTLRSSVIKRYALSLVGGIWTQICKNGMMGYEWTEVIKQKHTTQLNYESLQEYLSQGLDIALDQANGTFAWQNRLETVPVDEPAMKCLTYDLIDNGAVPLGGLKKFALAFDTEVRLSGKSSLYEIHAGATRLLNNSHPGHQPRKNRAIRRVCDDYMLDLAA